MPSSSTYLALAACLGVGGYLLVGGDKPAASSAAPRAVRTAKLPAIVVPPALHDNDSDEVELTEDEAVDIVAEEEPMRGLESLDDPAAFAMVFSIDGTSYLRLSQEARATKRGKAELIEADDLHAVVAPVATNAMPAEFREWAGKRVLVDGDCEARVVGFAEVSRIEGDASDPYSFDEEGNPTGPEKWTVEHLTEMNVTLAAVLDDSCAGGTWARATEYGPAAIAAIIESPALENAAKADLFAMIDDELTQSWKEQGGEGAWRDAASTTTTAWKHPLTNETWVFVQVDKPGYCGEPGFSKGAVFRAGSDGKLRYASELSADSINEVLDLDGDGQPELLTGGNRGADLVDLAGTSHDSISVPQHWYTCGC